MQEIPVLYMAVKTEKDLIIPFSWDQRRPIFLDRFFYIPAKCNYEYLNYRYFDNEAPIVIEFCSGNGEWIAERAKQNPHLNWIAVEKKFIRARQIWVRMHKENLNNLYVVCADARVFAEFYAPKVDEIYINFPDPWPKLRHAKHRLVENKFLGQVSKILNGDGIITCVTDDESYAQQMNQEFEKCPEFQLEFYTNEWDNFGRSFFANLWKRKGRKIHYICYKKKF